MAIKMPERRTCQICGAFTEGTPDPDFVGLYVCDDGITDSEAATVCSDYGFKTPLTKMVGKEVLQEIPKELEQYVIVNPDMGQL